MLGIVDQEPSGPLALDVEYSFYPLGLLIAGPQIMSSNGGAHG